MKNIPIRTTVVGSYPFPGWLEFATHNLKSFGAADVEEMIEDAVIAAIHDQVTPSQIVPLHRSDLTRYFLHRC